MKINRIFTVTALLLVLTLSLSSCSLLYSSFVGKSVEELLNEPLIDESSRVYTISETTANYGITGITFKLPNDFKQISDEDFDFYYVSPYANVFGFRDHYDSVTAQVYMKDFLEYNGINAQIQSHSDFIYCTLDEPATDDQEATRFYFCLFQKGSEFFMLEIAFFIADAGQVEPLVMTWAESVVMTGSQ